MNEVRTQEKKEIEFFNPDGSFNPLPLVEPDKRIQEINKRFPVETFNIIQMTQFVMSRIPKGVKFFPQVIQANPSTDFWTNKNASGLNLQDGQIELSAKFILKLGQSMGVRFKQTQNKIIKYGDIEYLSIKYIASIQLPDGTLLESSEVGKEEPFKTGNGKIKAHIGESVDMKAKRNALKEILNIPTQMLESEARKYWIVLKTVYNNNSLEHKEIEKKSQESIENLYEADTKEIEVKVEPVEKQQNIYNYDQLLKSEKWIENNIDSTAWNHQVNRFFEEYGHIENNNDMCSEVVKRVRIFVDETRNKKLESESENFEDKQIEGELNL